MKWAAYPICHFLPPGLLQAAEEVNTTRAISLLSNLEQPGGHICLSRMILNSADAYIYIYKGRSLFFFFF